MLGACSFQIFYTDPREIHWPTYMEHYCLGVKLYLAKEKLSGLPAAKAHLKKYVTRFLAERGSQPGRPYGIMHVL